MEDAATKIFIAVSGVLIVAILMGCIKLRDMIRDNSNQLKKDDEDIRDIKKEVAELFDLRQKDLIERKDLFTLAASIETRIDAKLRPFMAEIAEHRREDTVNMTKAVGDLDKTMGKTNTILEYVIKEIAEIKQKINNA